MQAFRIAIIGPEASGKTELALVLAQVLGGIATEEYARRYFEERNLPADYTLTTEEMCEVMHGQWQVEQGEGVLFIDASTIHGPLYAAMSRDESGRLAFDYAAVDRRIMDYAMDGGYDAFILCHPHAALKWVNDGMRSMPDFADRQAFADSCTAFVAKHYAAKPCIMVNTGTWRSREMQAMAETKKLLMAIFSQSKTM